MAAVPTAAAIGVPQPGQNLAAPGRTLPQLLQTAGSGVPHSAQKRAALAFS
jgi:hypothetical protein